MSNADCIKKNLEKRQILMYGIEEYSIVISTCVSIYYMYTIRFTIAYVKYDTRNQKNIFQG